MNKRTTASLFLTPSSPPAQWGPHEQGWYTRPLTQAQIQAALNSFGQSWRGPLQEKRWHFFTFQQERIMGALALFQGSYVIHTFFTLYDKESGTYYEYKKNLLPPLTQGAVAPSSLDSGSFLKTKEIFLEIIPKAQADSPTGYDLLFELNPQKKGQKAFSMQVELWEEGPPLVNLRDLSTPGRKVYTHQHSFIRSKGIAKWGNEEFPFNTERDVWGMDYTRGHHHHRTNWNWVCAGGLTQEGKRVAFNMADDITSGTNRVFALWFEGQLYRFESAHFDFNGQDRWNLSAERTLDPHGPQEVSLAFSPLAHRRENIPVPPLKTKFTQSYGTFQGELVFPQARYRIERIHGVAEHHWAHW